MDIETKQAMLPLPGQGLAASNQPHVRSQLERLLILTSYRFNECSQDCSRSYPIELSAVLRSHNKTIAWQSLF